MPCGSSINWSVHRQVTSQEAVCPENDIMSTLTIVSCGKIIFDVTYRQVMKESIQETHSKISEVVLELHNRVLRGFQCCFFVFFFLPIIFSESQAHQQVRTRRAKISTTKTYMFGRDGPKSSFIKISIPITGQISSQVVDLLIFFFPVQKNI